MSTEEGLLVVCTLWGLGSGWTWRGWYEFNRRPKPIPFEVNDYSIHPGFILTVVFAFTSFWFGAYAVRNGWLTPKYTQGEVFRGR